jgi:hypothetical protein
MIEANEEYYRMAEQRHELGPNIEFWWDVKPVMSSAPKYPDETYAKRVILNWFKRLELL